MKSENGDLARCGQATSYLLVSFFLADDLKNKEMTSSFILLPIGNNAIDKGGSI